MKKIIIPIVIVVLAVAGIGTYFVLNNKSLNENEQSAKDVLDNSQIDTSNDENVSGDNSNADTGDTSGKILVTYFSKAGENYGVGTVSVGNTAIMASYMVDYLKADSFEIVPVNPYPDDYEEAKTRSQQETRDNARPEITKKINNFDDYDVIFIGYPIWYGDYPMIINTFLESYDFTGKTVIPFNTHEGSGESGTYSNIKNKLSTANVNTNGLALQGKTARTDAGKEQTINWLKSLNY